MVDVLPTERVQIWDSLGRVLAVDVKAGEDVPPFANSAMDGFAVRAEDVAEAGAVLQVIADLPAGESPSVPVGPGEAVKIMTGAPMPEGADTIVKVEDTEPADRSVTIVPSVAPGTSVRPAGGDVVSGQLIFAAGTMLTPIHVGVLATVGIAEPEVHRRPKVAFMSTGDELTPVDGGPLGPGMIRDSNRPMLKPLLEEAGAELIDLGVVPDDEQALRQALQEGSRADAIVTTGGVSMGDYDVTKLVLREDSNVEFWKIAIQPAKPFAFGSIGDALFFGLPGNPVSVLVSFEQFVRPALLKMQGADEIHRRQSPALAAERFVTDPEKTVFLRVQRVGERDGLTQVALSGGQSSNVLSAAAAADAFAVVPRGRGVVEEGERVMIELFKSPSARSEGD